jgi:hypothetical protein
VFELRMQNKEWSHNGIECRSEARKKEKNGE